ncbi:MAG: hypothetical protein LUC25_07155 [Ruminococcus sp.]|nr:hypothetical protein [Ruminococcus sp.]
MATPRKVLINYANEAFRKAQKANTWTSKHIAGFDEVIEYGPDDVDEEFRNKYKDIFAYKRGNGLWLWKPYLILKTLNKMQDGDILVYLDSGAFWCRSANPIFEVLNKEDIYVVSNPLVEKQFTKKRTFEIMDCFDDKYTESSQIQASIIGLKKSRRSVELMNKFLSYCCDVDNIASDIIGEGIDVTFVAHREDQSILSLLVKKENIKSHKDPTQYGVLPEKYGKGKYIYRFANVADDYKPMIVLHRSGRMKFKNCFNQWLCCVLPICISRIFI